MKLKTRNNMNKHHPDIKRVFSGYRLILVSVLFFASLLLLAQSVDFPPWPVPDEANEITNPVPADKKSLEEGMAFYNINCKACHGDYGLGDGVIPAANLISKATQDQTDGAWFYKLQEGRGQMPSFRTAKETDLWNVINYMRSLATPREEIVRKNAVMKLVFTGGDSLNEVTAMVYEIMEDSSEMPAGEMKVGFFVKRLFGDLRIGGDRTYTDDQGKVTIAFPDDLPGDSEGRLTVIVRLEDMEFNPLEIQESIDWGLTKGTYWTEKRALWKDNAYVPWWVLLSYAGITGGVWITIIYVMLQLKKIHDMNRSKSKA